jgi:lipopolysaccharide transport system permease protein
VSLTSEQSAGGPPAADPDAAHRPHREMRRVVIKPSKGVVSFPWREFWEYRELLGFLAWRDIKVRYKQTAFGAAWAVIQPLALMLVFALFVGHFLGVKSGDVPYPVFAFTALLPWTLFSQSLAMSSESLVASANLVSKVYFPRLILPFAATGPFILDFLVGFVVLAGMLVVYGVSPTAGIVLVPAFALLALLAAVGFGVWLSALNARYRDVHAAIPLLIQVWLFASPIAYPVSLVPHEWRTVYALNPMVSVVSGMRWGLTGAPAPTAGMVLASVGATLVVLVTGIAYFRSTERTFADVI